MLCLLQFSLNSTAQLSLGKFEKQQLKIKISNIGFDNHPIDYPFITLQREFKRKGEYWKYNPVNGSFKVDESIDLSINGNPMLTNDSIEFYYYNTPKKLKKIEGVTLINPKVVFLNKSEFVLPFSTRFYQKIEYLDTLTSVGHNADKLQSNTISSIPIS